MEGLESQVNPEVWAQIQEQFEKLQNESGVEVDEDYQKELEQLFGMTYDEMNREAEIAMKTRTLQVELIHKDAKFPTYAYPSD
jgi:phage terminase small subunit